MSTAEHGFWMYYIDEETVRTRWVDYKEDEFDP